jgi:hypothetical protein
MPLDVLYYVSGNQIVLTKKGEEEALLLSIKNISDDKKDVPQSPLYKPITGKVTNERGDGLEGASVTIKGTNRVTVTNSAGVFSIDAEVGKP